MLGPFKTCIYFLLLLNDNGSSPSLPYDNLALSIERSLLIGLQFKISGEVGKDSCQSDSGGALLMRSEHSEFYKT
jgi:hypothetical protein